MNEQTLDDLARRTAPALNRRFSLAALGAATLAVLGRPAIGEAGKAGKKAKKQCKKQRGPCEVFIRETCSTEEEVEECLQGLLPCCGSLARCNFTAFALCFGENI